MQLLVALLVALGGAWPLEGAPVGPAPSAPFQEGRGHGEGVARPLTVGLLQRALQRFDSSKGGGAGGRRTVANRRSLDVGGRNRENLVTEEAGKEVVGDVARASTQTMPATTSNPATEEETTTLPVNIYDGQYHEVNPGQYHEDNPGQYHEDNPGQYYEEDPGQYHEQEPGQYHEINPGQYEAVVEYNEEERTKSYNVHRKTGNYIIGEVGKINISNGQTLEGVRYTAVEGMVDQAQIAAILKRYFGAGR